MVVSALASMLAPSAVVLALLLISLPGSIGSNDDGQGFLFLYFMVAANFIGAVPALISWAVCFRPIVIQGRHRPQVRSVKELARSTAIVGGCWGLLFSLVSGWWVWIPIMALAGIVPGLAYGVWLDGEMRTYERLQVEVSA